MYCINNTCTDAYFNIASEEYLLKNSREDFFMIYRNEPSVIIGKHQHVKVEINTDFASQKNLKIVRRYSGGGAVFHDLGNLNLAFIEKNESLAFSKYITLMTNLLSEFGIKTEINSRRALFVDGRKISGSAQSVYKDRVLYHATLLYSSDLENLEKSLDGDVLEALQIKEKKLSVRSVKSPVTNLENYLNFTNIEDFSQAVLQYFLSADKDNKIYEFNYQDLETINSLINNKYLTQDWNYNACATNKNVLWQHLK